MLLGGLGVYNIGVSITATIMVQTIIKFKGCLIHLPRYENVEILSLPTILRYASERTGPLSLRLVITQIFKELTWATESVIRLEDFFIFLANSLTKVVQIFW